jgi:hypothetical protein
LQQRGSVRVIAKPDGDAIHRLIIDDARHQYFGYDMSVQVLPDGSFDVSFAPLSVSPASLLPDFQEATLEAAVPARYREPQRAESGDMIALELFISADGRQRIVDYIRFSSQNHPPRSG